MDDEHDRQQRDLQRATALLEAMSREDIVEMLLDILSNERSDDTRKLSDWMAFQIILHDETRPARALLAQLGKDGRNHQRSKMSQMSSASRQIPTSSRPAFNLHDDALDEDSSSNASFATCTEAEPVDAVTLKDGVVDEGALDEVQAMNRTFTNTPETQLGDDPDFDHSLRLSTPQEKGPDRGGEMSTFGTRWFSNTIPRGKPRTSSESNTSNEESQKPGALKSVASSSLQSSPSQNKPFPTIRPQESNKIRPKSTEANEINELGYKNLAELYARYDRHREERRDSDLKHLIDEGSTHGSGTSESDRVLDLMEMRRCQYCRRYFTTEQNLLDLDSGSSPCSYHPGKVAWTSAQSGGPFWTCCHREISRDDYLSNPKKSPGCENGYHLDTIEYGCCFCDQTFPEKGTNVELDRSPRCSHHPGSTVFDAKVGQMWTCCGATAYHDGLWCNRRLYSRSPGCKMSDHRPSTEVFYYLVHRSQEFAFVP